MSGYVTTTSDSGGVHINSGIPNHAFYLAATAIGGHAWDGAGQIWYDVLTGGTLAADVDFAGFAAATVWAAGARFGEGSSQQLAVRDAWAQVEVRASSAPSGASSSPSPAGDIVRVERSGGIAGRLVARDVDLDGVERAAGPVVAAAAAFGPAAADPDRPAAARPVRLPGLLAASRRRRHGGRARAAGRRPRAARAHAAP